MNAKRKKVEAFILSNLDKIIPGDDTNSKLMAERFSRMDDSQFEDFIRTQKPAWTPEDIKLREHIPFVIPNLGKKRISIANNYRIARELGRSMSHRLIMTDPHTGLSVVTPHTYPVLDLPVRRQAQTVAKKSSIPDKEQRIDDLTHQPVSQSKGSRISAPELMAMNSRGLVNTIAEFINVRGGNQNAYREMVRLISETGECTLAQLQGMGIAKSAKTAAIILNGMMLGNNLDPSTKVPEDAR